MRGLVALSVLLLVVKFIKNISGELFDIPTNARLILSGSQPKGDLQQCIVVHNGVNYNIHPQLNITGVEYTGRKILCSFRIIDIQFDHAGEWSIRTISKSDKGDLLNSNETSIVRVTEQETILPTKTFNGENGTYATVYFQNAFNNGTKCYVTKNGYANNTIYMLNDGGNGTSVGFEIYGKCGVRMPINEKWHGNWELVQECGDYKIKSGKFQIIFHSKKPPTELRQKFSLGLRGIIRFNPYSHIYCELEQPDGQIIPLKQSSCTFEINKVSDKHSGIWKARYISKYSMDVVEEKIIVDVIDPQAIDVTVTKTDDKLIHMLCEPNVSTIQYCTFTKPDGTTLHAVPGIGNDKYEYFGTGYDSISSSSNPNCGLTIRNPSDNDYGLWKCTINVNSDENISSFVSIANLTEGNTKYSDIIKNDVYVKRGDNFLIRCTTDKSLDYCWLQSPNRTSYSVIKYRGNSLNSLKYVGEGLSVGVCGANIENADDTHTGNWTCRLGIAGGAEIKSIVPVTVTDSYIIPIHHTINVAYDEPRLLVKILPKVDATIKYCRWVRPNGDGFNEEDAAKYIELQNKTTCILFIKDFNSADIGIWNCYARLIPGSDEEIHTSIELISYSQSKSNLILNIFAVGLVTIMIIGGIIFGIIFHKKRMVYMKKSSSHYNEFDTSKHYPITVKESSNF